MQGNSHDGVYVFGARERRPRKLCARRERFHGEGTFTGRTLAFDAGIAKFLVALPSTGAAKRRAVQLMGAIETAGQGGCEKLLKQLKISWEPNHPHEMWVLMRAECPVLSVAGAV